MGMNLADQLALSERVRAFADKKGIPFAEALDRIKVEDRHFAASLREAYGGGASEPETDQSAMADAVSRAHEIMQERNLSFGRALEALRTEEPYLYDRATRHYSAR